MKKGDLMTFGFEQLAVWQHAMDLAQEIYRLSKKFPEAERFGIIAQMQRAAVSVAANIAEGKGRYHTKMFVQFLYNARGSLYELVTLLMLARNLHYLTEEEYQGTLQSCRTIISQLSGLINSMK